MSDTLDRVLARLDNPRQHGDKWSARCPAHDDAKPSLGVWLGDNGAVILCCQAGCDKEAILAGLGLAWPDLFPEKANGDGRSQIVDRYPYVDESGELLFEVVRLDPKSFRQRVPDKTTPSGWRWKLGDTRRVLYRLPEVLAAAAKGDPVFIVEGERDVHAVEALGEVATTCPGGAGKWRPEFTEALRGADVVVVADRDAPGRAHARTVAAAVATVADVRCAEPHNGKDLADHVSAGHSIEELDLIVDRWADTESVPADEDGQKKSAATVLVEMAQELFDFAVTTSGEPFAVPRTGPRVVALLRGGKTSLRALLARTYFRETGRAAPQQSLADALAVLDGFAQEADEVELASRVADHDGALWLDLGDLTGRAVRITATGWTVEESTPVLFRRTALNAPLPEPVRGGNLDELWSWLNIGEGDRAELAAWLVAALHPAIPHPVLSLAGEQGSGKSSAARVLVSVLDPSPAPTRKPPRDADSWVTAAAGSWLVALDNLSAIPDWLSDTLCRAVTGEGDVRRRLYTDGDLSIIAFRRCVILTGIDLGAVNGDLADRLLPVELDPIPATSRREEARMWEGWDEAHPRILGAVLDLAAGVAGQAGHRYGPSQDDQRGEGAATSTPPSPSAGASQAGHQMGGPSVEPTSRPRMADYARVLDAVDQVLGTSGLARYLDKQGHTAVEALTGDPFIVALADTLVDVFEGTSAELSGLVQAPDRLPKGWPGNARQVTQLLRRQAPPMRKAGWTITDDGGANKAGVLRWTVAHPEIARNGRLPPPPALPTGAQAGVAGQAGHEYGPSQDDRGSCDLCGAVTLRRAGDGAWRHTVCEAP